MVLFNLCNLDCSSGGNFVPYLYFVFYKFITYEKRTVNLYWMTYLLLFLHLVLGQGRGGLVMH